MNNLPKKVIALKKLLLQSNRYFRLKNDPPSNGQRSPHHWANNNGGVNHNHRASPLSSIVHHDNRAPPATRGRSPRGRPPPSNANNAAILAAAQAAGMPMSALDPVGPMSSMNALLAAAQVRYLFRHKRKNAIQNVYYLPLIAFRGIQLYFSYISLC